MSNGPTKEECKICSDNYNKQIESLRNSLENLHYGINKTMREYARLHMEEEALEQISDLVREEDIADVLDRIRKICDDAEEKKKDMEK